MGNLCLRSLGDKCERRIFSCSPILKEASIIWEIRVLTSNVLNKINIISAAGLWGINVSNEHFLLCGRVVFGYVFLCIPNIAQFRVLIMSLIKLILFLLLKVFGV